jgi:molybdopterin-guanine dinucleotide biosynthesis protein A
MSLGAVVICGGMGRRMGGPKALLPFGSESLLERMVRLVGVTCGPIVVVAAEGQSIPALPDSVRVVTDRVADRGPLQALQTGLEAHDSDVDLVYVTATDAPFLAAGWISRLVEIIGSADIAIPVVDGRSYPLNALYRRLKALSVIDSQLDHDVLRLKSILPLLDVREVGADDLRAVDPNLSTLINLNTPDDYRDALARAGFSSGRSV